MILSVFAGAPVYGAAYGRSIVYGTISSMGSLEDSIAFKTESDYMPGDKTGGIKFRFGTAK